MTIVLIVLAILTLVPLGTGVSAGALPELPRATVDTTLPAVTGTVISVPAGGNFQSALDTAQLGDAIELAAGATYRGTFQLHNRTSGAGWITIRSSRHAELPPPGTRISPTQAPLMATIVAPGVANAIRTDEGSHHYRFIGIEVTGEAIAATANNSRFIQLDGEHTVGTTTVFQTTIEQAPHHIVFDRCYVHGGPDGGGSYIRGFLLNGLHLAVIDSYVSGFKSNGSDTQAIASWNGPGPFKIQNNYLEATGENVMFGGAYATIPGLIPSDIEIRGNLIAKPLTWRLGDPSYAGVPYVIKNLFEVKNGQRILIENNTFQDHWAAAQAGFAIVTSPRSQTGGNPWVVASDLMFRNNLFSRTTAGVYIWGHDNTTEVPVGTVLVTSARVAFLNNIWEDLGIYVVSGAHNGVMMMIQNGLQDITFSHNTILKSRAGSNIFFSHPPSDGMSTGFVIQNNIFGAGGYLIQGSGRFGVAALDYQATGWIMDHNVVYGPWPTVNNVGHGATAIPQTNFFPDSIDTVGFTSLGSRDYHLTLTSPYHNGASDGTDPGWLSPVAPPPPPATVVMTINAPSIQAGGAGETVTAPIYVGLNSAVGLPTGSVSLTVDGGTPLTQAIGAGTVTFSIINPTVGDHPLVASYEGSGVFAPATASATLTVTPTPQPPPPPPPPPPPLGDVTPPVVTVTRPTSGTHYSSTNGVVPVGVVTDVGTGVKSVTATLDGVKRDICFNTSTGAWNINRIKTIGGHTLTISATDFAGNTTNVSVPFIIP